MAKAKKEKTAEVAVESDGDEDKKPKRKKIKLDDLVGTNFVGGQHILDRKHTIIPVSPQLDLALNGGIRDGSFVVVTGPPKVGKSTTMLDFAFTATLPRYADKDIDKTGRNIWYFNIEGRLQSRDLTGLQNFNINKFNVIGSAKGKILTAEDYIEIGEMLINEKPGDIFIFDSFSQLCTEARYDSSVGDRFRDDTSLLLANFCKRICNITPVNNSIVIGITHLIANQGGKPGESKWSEASGRKIQYNADVKLRATHKTDWKYDGYMIGQEVHWDCETSNLWNGKFNGQVTSYLRYGYGVDKDAELITLASQLGIIKKSGSWYEFPDKANKQGIEKAREYLLDSGMYIDIYNSARDMLGLPPV